MMVDKENAEKLTIAFAGLGIRQMQTRQGCLRQGLLVFVVLELLRYMCKLVCGIRTLRRQVHQAEPHSGICVSDNRRTDDQVEHWGREG
jgi:hypothetical protein